MLYMDWAYSSAAVEVPRRMVVHTGHRGSGEGEDSIRLGISR